jgi:hypothetical protein
VDAGVIRASIGAATAKRYLETHVEYLRASAPMAQPQNRRECGRFSLALTLAFEILRRMSRKDEMSRSKRKSTRQLIRTSATFVLDSAQWPCVLIALEDAGWKPPQSRLAYLAGGTIVSDDEAKEMTEAADLLVNAALDDRIWRQSLGRIDLDVFMKVREFLKDGSFRIG